MISLFEAHPYDDRETDGSGSVIIPMEMKLRAINKSVKMKRTR